MPYPFLIVLLLEVSLDQLHHKEMTFVECSDSSFANSKMDNVLPVCTAHDAMSDVSRRT